MSQASRQKFYAIGQRPDIRVPFTEVRLTPPVHASDEAALAPSLRMYDTSGPGSDPAVGLPRLRRAWVLDRHDVEEVEGRRALPRDDGRSAARIATPQVESTPSCRLAATSS